MRKLKSLATPLNLVRISWPDFAVTVGPVIVVIVLALAVAVLLVKPAPPHTLTITAGGEGSAFRQTAEEYRDILARDAVRLEVLASSGAQENLERLDTPSFKADVGFVQSGLADERETAGLVSLGSIYYEPIWVFYRGNKPLDQLSQLRGLRVAVGHEGSGTRVLALRLLEANGIERNAPTLRAIGNQAAAQALRNGQLDAAFVIGDPAAPVVKELLAAPGISLMSFSQADAYVRRFPYLYKLVLPKGALDLRNNLPPQDVFLIGPTAELIARDNLHPALSDLLIEAAQEVHGGADLFSRAGEFPAPREHDFALSQDAQRFYKSGRRFLHRYLPFWLANLVDRALVLLVPIVAVAIPGLRLAPALYRWRVRSRLYRWYAALIALERDALRSPTPERGHELLGQIDAIESAVNGARMPVSFADQVYVLRQHITFVRDRLSSGVPGQLRDAVRESA